MATGRHEFLIGYSLWGADGKRRWSHDAELKDHADALSLGNFSGPPVRGRAARISTDRTKGSWSSLRMGHIVKHLRLGHAQTQSIGKYRA